MLKVRSSVDETIVLDWKKDLVLGHLCDKKSQLRPHIVWFGEDVPMIERAVEICETADILIIIGTSMQVYPAASLVEFAQSHVPVFYIDPKPAINYSLEQSRQLEVIEAAATLGMSQLFKQLVK